MSNDITASVEFFFRGKKIASAIELNLDEYMQSSGKLPDLYPLLARQAGLDLYSYEYEMMRAEVIRFSDAGDLATDFITDGVLDIDAFEQSWKDNRVIEQLQQVAKQQLSIEDIEQHPEVKQALLEAWRLGKNAG